MKENSIIWWHLKGPKIEGLQFQCFELIIHIFKGGYCCAPGDDYGDCSEMIRYGMSLIDPLIDTNEFKCIHYRHPVSYFVMLHNLCIYRLTHFWRIFARLLEIGRLPLLTGYHSHNKRGVFKDYTNVLLLLALCPIA